MARTVVFESAMAQLSSTRRPTTPRHISSKLQEIALRSPQDLRALEVLADMVLERLNESDRSTLH